MLIGQKIEILDSTLREGEQTPGVSFTVDQKIIMANRLDVFGVDFIELGHPAVSPAADEARWACCPPTNDRSNQTEAPSGSQWESPPRKHTD